MSRSRDGQLFTVDVIASLFVFILIVNLAMMTWNLAERNSVMFNEERALRDRAGRMADLLVRMPGYPEDWTADTVEIIGLTEPDHVIAVGKMEEFDSLSYNEQQELLRTRQADFRLEVADNGTAVNVSSGGGNLTLSFGKEPTEEAETAAVSDRRVLVNESNSRGYTPAVLELVFWQ